MNSSFTVKEISSILEELTVAKSEILGKLKDLKVTATDERDSDVMTAVRNLYGEEAIKDGKTSISFEMVAQCIDIVRRAGKAKAAELIK